MYLSILLIIVFLDFKKKIRVFDFGIPEASSWLTRRKIAVKNTNIKKSFCRILG